MASSPTEGAPLADSLTAQDYINSQLHLESEARDALPYSFDTCTRPLGLLRQAIYSCRTCTAKSSPPRFGNPTTTPPADAAAICYACSISCHGDHELVEIFEKRNVTCDCGTKRIPGKKCTLTKAVDEAPVDGKAQREYGQNYWGRFCECEIEYKPEFEEGTMYQCLLGDVCGEDWFHDVCIVGAGPPEYHPKAKNPATAKAEAAVGSAEVIVPERTTEETPKKKTGHSEASSGEKMEAETQKTTESTVNANDSKPTDGTSAENVDVEEDEDEVDKTPPGFPCADDFEHFICWRCVDANPWLRRYAGTPGFLPAVPRLSQSTNGSAKSASNLSPKPEEFPTTEPFSDRPTMLKRKSSLSPPSPGPSAKRARTPDHTPTLSNSSSDSSVMSSASMISTAATSVTSSIIADTKPCILPPIPPSPPSTTPVSLFLTENFRSHLCHCTTCFPHLSRHPCLLEEEETYSPPKDEDAASDAGSLYDEGERALQGVDRVKAIEGLAMFELLKGKVKDFLRPFAEKGETVAEKDVRAWAAALKDGVNAPKESK